MAGRGAAYRERADTTASQQVAEAWAVLEGMSTHAKQIGQINELAASSLEVTGSRALTSIHAAAKLIESSAAQFEAIAKALKEPRQMGFTSQRLGSIADVLGKAAASSS